MMQGKSQILTFVTATQGQQFLPKHGFLGKAVVYFYVFSHRGWRVSCTSLFVKFLILFSTLFRAVKKSD